MARRKIQSAEGMSAVRSVCSGSLNTQELATATRFLLEEIAAIAPGKTVEVRVPPYGATQCVAGPSHTRGTPPNVVEMSPEVWIAVATGNLCWTVATAEAQIIASGSRADLSHLMPIIRASWASPQVATEEG